MSVYAGFDIGGTKCAVSIGRKAKDGFEILAREAFPTPKAQEDAMARMCALAKSLARGEAISGVGLSAGNPMDAKAGMLKNPPNLPGWTDVCLTDIAREALGAPAVLENDANACALAEYRFGAGRGARNMVFCTFGTGFGAGLILEGKLYRGACGNAGELGHWRIRDEGPSGYGKMGALEGFCSGGGIAQLATTVMTRYIQIGVAPAFARGEISAKTVAEAARAGDAAALEVFEICAERLGQGLALVVDLINPDRIVLGSIYERCEDLLTGAMRRALAREALADSLALAEIVPAQLGDRIGDYAALALACYAEEGEGWR
jgi:glucokinase